MKDIDSPIAEASAHVTAVAREILFDGRPRLLTAIAKALDRATADAIADGAARYAAQFLRRYGVLRFLGCNAVVPLTARQFDVQLVLAGHRDEGFVSPSPSPDGRSALELADAIPYLLVLGPSGSGKSTVLKTIGVETLTGRKLGQIWKQSYLPVYIECKSFTDPKLQLQKEIAERFRRVGFPSPEKLTDKALSAGRLCIILDGVGQVAGATAQETIAQIEDLIAQYPKNRYIASDRLGFVPGAPTWPEPAAIARLLDLNARQFQSVAIAPLDDRQCHHLSSLWFERTGTERSRRSAFWHDLDRLKRGAPRNLARTPLGSILLCWVYARSQQLPDDASALYARAIDLLLDRALSETEAFAGAPLPCANPRQRAIDWLSELAYRGLVSNSFWFSPSEIGNHCPPELNPDPTAIDPVAAIGIGSGILHDLDPEECAFSHLSLQEYLSARYIQQHRLSAQTVNEFLLCEQWQAVFLFLAGIRQPTADKLLLLMEATGRAFIRSSKVKSLLQWCDRLADGDRGPYKPSARRAAALFLMLAIDSTLKPPNAERMADSARELGSEIDLLAGNDRAVQAALDLAQLLELDTIAPISRARRSARELTRNLTFARHRALDLDRGARELTRDLAQKLARDRARQLPFDVDFALKRNLDVAVDRVRDLAFVNILARELEQMQLFENGSRLIESLEVFQLAIPSDNDSAEIHFGFRDRIRQSWSVAWECDPQWLDLSDPQRQELADYLRANWAIVRCYQVARTVTPTTWKVIEERMLCCD
ncbi:hypothetical protein JJD41_00140 [Oxynema sp. CENA135]|uniref:NACHT domain-containing protein n=1 Tax=Oxynema sp. CENA135 TaxID=984206 RepID=UPI001909CA50|nr:hypothetical protein [Oxynema sp. CENA135]MBK4728305.1 hypothetical protein [Oxynema sp. CENA135]